MTSLSDRLTELASVLDDLAHALAGGRADEVLVIEPLLAEVVERLKEAVGGPVPVAERERVVRGCRLVQVALFRCRALGHASASLERLLVPPAAYGAPGRLALAPSVATVESTV